mmetsp:Transcript_78966/g.139510  ORF Transcript_78966/g.139510 Transcript_78966/m.139510 type:complete len:169 (-) Transcript_78966:956-1462(-)
MASSQCSALLKHFSMKCCTQKLLFILLIDQCKVEVFFGGAEHGVFELHQAPFSAFSDCSHVLLALLLLHAFCLLPSKAGCQSKPKELDLPCISPSPSSAPGKGEGKCSRLRVQLSGSGTGCILAHNNLLSLDVPFSNYLRLKGSMDIIPEMKTTNFPLSCLWGRGEGG